MFCFRTVLPINEEKSGQNADIKNCDVDPYYGSAQNSGVCVKQDGNQNAAKEKSAKKRGEDVRIVWLQFALHVKEIYKHGKKQKLDVFPRGFVDRKEKTDDRIFSAPLINKMCQCTKNGNEDNSRQYIFF